MTDFNKTASKWNEVKLKALGKYSPKQAMSITMGNWPHKANDRTFTVSGSPAEVNNLNLKLADTSKR